VSGASSRKVIVMAALKQEAAPLARALAGLEDKGLRLVRSGVGLARAEGSARKHLPGASLLISTGCCGGLVPGASNGLLVVPREVLHYTPERGHGEPVPSPDEQWVNLASSLAEQRGHHCTARPLASVAKALTSTQAKETCHRQCGAVAVDMESAALARVAGELSVPHLVVRHVLDSVSEPLPEREVADADGKIHPLKLARAMTRPRDFLGRAQLHLRLKSNANAVAPLIRRLVEEAL